MRFRLAARVAAVAVASLAAVPAVPAYAGPADLTAHCTFAGVLTPLNELHWYATGVAVAPAAVRTEVSCRLVTSAGTIGRADRACTGSVCAVAFATGGTVVEPAVICVSARAEALDTTVIVQPETCNTILA